MNFWRIEELGIHNHPNLHLVEYDLTDVSAGIRLLESASPTEVYNLAAQSFVGVSFEQPVTTAQITGMSPLNLLEAIRIVNPNIRFYQAYASFQQAREAIRGTAVFKLLLPPLRNRGSFTHFSIAAQECEV